jgi:hypothetical protein
MNVAFDVMYGTQDGGSKCCETAWHGIVQQNCGCLKALANDKAV